MDVSTLLYLKWVTDKDLQYSPGNSAMWQSGWVGSLYMYDSVFLLFT